MNTSAAQDKIKAALKQALKKQNSTYNDVAKVWGCSVPTVKRLLGKEELPLSRLLSLLDWLNLTLTDLHKLAESDVVTRPQFTARQNEFLAKHPPLFALFMKLYEDETPQSVAKKYGIPQATMDRWLIQLEKYDLIRVGAGGKVRPYWPDVPHLNGPLGSAHFKNIMDSFNTYFKYQVGKNLAREKGASTFHWTVLEIREQTWHMYRDKITKLIAELESISKQEGHIYKKSELRMGVLASGFHLDDIDSPDLKIVTDIFARLIEESKEI